MSNLNHINPGQPLHTEGGAGHGSPGVYAIGFILSIILTVIPFAIVMTGGFSQKTMLAVMFGFGVIQVVVHLVCFLHMNASSEGRWNLLAFIFTLVVILLLVGLSIWIIFSANALMM